MTQIQKLTTLLNRYESEKQGKVGHEYKMLLRKIDAAERNLKLAQENTFINGGI